MKYKLRDYVDTVFSDVMFDRETNELKADVYKKLCESYDKHISNGRSEAAAYSAAIAELGDISYLIEKKEHSTFGDVRENASDACREPSGTDDQSGYGNAGIDEDNGEDTTNYRRFTASEQETVDRYRMVSGIMMSVAVALYILCWVPLVVLGGLIDAEWSSILGLVIMMVTIAIATALIIIRSALKPAILREVEGFDESSAKSEKNKDPLLNALTTVVWCLCGAAYIFVSIHTSKWNITWIIFIIAAAIENIIKAVFEIVTNKYSDHRDDEL